MARVFAEKQVVDEVFDDRFEIGRGAVAREAVCQPSTVQ